MEIARRATGSNDIKLALNKFKNAASRGFGLKTAQELLADLSVAYAAQPELLPKQKIINDIIWFSLLRELTQFIAEATNTLQERGLLKAIQFKEKNEEGNLTPAVPLRSSLFAPNNNNNNQPVPSRESLNVSQNNNNNNSNIIELVSETIINEVQQPTNILRKETVDLLFAIKIKDLGEVKRWITKDNDLINKTIDGASPLHMAAAYGSSEIINYFIDECKIPVNVLDKNDQTVFHYAIKNGNGAVLSCLEDAAYNFFGSDKAGRTAFINQKNKPHGYTALIEALKLGDLPNAQYLCLYPSADITVVDNHGKSAIYWLATKAIMFSGEDGTNKNIQENLPVFLVDFMSCPGAKEEIEKEFTGQALAVLAAKAGNLAFIKFLVKQKGVGILSLQDAEGTSLFHYAAKSGNLDLLKYLFNELKGTDINLTNNSNETILMFAVQSKKLEVVQYLIDQDAHLDAMSNKKVNDIYPVNNHYKYEKRTALHYAVLSKNLEITKALVDAGADKMLEDESKQTPVGYANKAGYNQVLGAFFPKQPSTFRM